MKFLAALLIVTGVLVAISAVNADRGAWLITYAMLASVSVYLGVKLARS